MLSKKESGAQGRKRRKIQQERQAKQAGSLDRFLVSAPERAPESSTAVQESQEPDQVPVDVPLAVPQTETVSVEDASHCQGRILQECFDQSVFIDIGCWPDSVDDALKTELVKRGTAELQNQDVVFPKDSNGRSFSKDWFYMNLDNGETMLRTWLVFSPVKKAAFCFPCMLFQKAKGKSSFGKNCGFSAWRKLNPRLLEHERSSYHVDAFTMWKEFEMRLQKSVTIDAAAQLAQQRSFEKWKAVLGRILDCILYLARQALPLRGHLEDLSTDENSGNFLETFKLLARYDPVANQHLQKVQKKDGYVVSYLSPQSQNEFICLLGDHVRRTIIQKVEKAKYFAIMFDSTPDISHIDQMSQVIRYVNIEDKEVNVAESFIDFVQLTGKSADAITRQICEKLQADGLKLEHCYGQGYDNAATMAGHISGVQKRILDKNPKALFVPCNNHCLNLAGVHAAGVGTQSLTFFGIVEKVYTFFASSTHRWDVLKEHVPVHLKRWCDTRWSSKHDAVRVFADYVAEIVGALEALRDGPSETSETKGDAGSLLVCIMTYSFLSFLHFWSPVLAEINDAQVYLQQKGLGLDQCAQKLDALAIFCAEERDSLVSCANQKALEMCETYGIETQKRISRRKKMPGERSDDVGLTLAQETRREQLEAIDKLRVEIMQRTVQMKALHERFAFLNIKALLDDQMDDCINEQIRRTCTEYSELSAVVMMVEVHRLRRHIALYKVLNPDEQVDSWSALDLLRWVYKWKLQESFANIVVVLRIFLTITVSTASCERSFSKLKLIKTYQRSTMTQERLSNLAILSIERDSKVDFDKVIEKFAFVKSRRF